MIIPKPEKQQDPGPTLLGDQPAREAKDPLGFGQIAERLAAVVQASRGSTPFTLGIEGGWGVGKSTLMHHLREKLDPSRLRPPKRTLLRAVRERLRLVRSPERPLRVTTVWFNAWTADDRGVLEGLIKTVLNELDPNILRRSLRDEKLMTWLRFVAGVVASWLRLGNVVDDFWKRVAGDPRARNELQELMTKAMEDRRGRNEKPDAKQLLCVFVDDLDRCSPGGVFEVFEAIKLYLDMEGLVFVVGFDQDIVSDAILGEKQYGKSVTSRDYLEKIVQIAYRIPRPGRDEAAAFLDACLAQSHNQQLLREGGAERLLVLERNARNPRRIKRFLNGFVVAYGLNPEWADFTRESLVRVHLLDMYFPRFARLLDRSAQRDPVEELLTYRDARDALRQQADRGTEPWELVVRAFASYKLKPSTDDPPVLLQTLQQYVTPPLTELVTQEEFVSLVETLAAAKDWDRLRRRLAEGRIRPASPAAAGARTFEPPAVDLTGLTVLWIDGRSDDENRAFADAMTELGAHVTPANNAREAHELFASGARNDVLVLDVARADEPDGGMTDLQQLQSAGVAPPRAIFFTSHITASQEARASGLGASITSDPRVLFETLARREPVIDPAVALREAEAGGDPNAAAELVKLLSLRNEWQDAADVLERLEERGSVTASVDLGNLLLQHSETAKAEAAFRRAIATEDLVATSLGAIGLAGLLAENDFEGARSAYEHAIDAGHPNHGPRAAIELGNLLAEHGEIDSARAAYERATGFRDSDHAARAADLLEHLLARQGDAAGAPAAYEHAGEYDHLIARFTPLLRYDSHEQFFADSAAQWTECPGNELRRKDLAEGKKGEVIARAAPMADEPKLTLAFLGPTEYANGAPTEPGDLIGHSGKDYRDSYVQLRATRPDLNNVVYGRAVMHDDRLWLQYWFWYFYNDYQLASGVGTHEGDWELVQLRMHPSEDRPDVAVYRQHRYGERRLWPGVEKVGERPVVYVARGSHASYFEAGFHQTEAWYDLADGKRPAPGLRLELIRPDTHAWMLWNGRWGDTKPNAGVQSNAPAGPGRKKEWTRPGDLLDAARREATLAESPAAPDVVAIRDSGKLRIDYDVTQRHPRPSALIVTVKLRDERGVSPTTHSFKELDASGRGSLRTDIMLHPDRHYDVYTSAILGDPPKPSESLLVEIAPVLQHNGSPSSHTAAHGISKLLTKLRGS